MADSKRRLNIPIFETGPVPEGVTHDDAIEVEVIEATPTLGERLRARARSTDSGPGPRQGRRSGPRQRQAAEAKQARAERVQLSKEARRDPLAKLRLDVAVAGEAYMDSIRRAGILAEGQTKATQHAQLTGLHQIYASMMVLQCVQPLQQGLSGQNVVSALGMAASMWALSPDFRTQLGAFRGELGEAIRAKIEERGEKKDNRAKSRFEKLAAEGKADQLSSRWRKRLDRIENAERGHRLPFTAQSAAMTEVALAEAAYADMRKPGADAAAVYSRYESALGALYTYIDDDGLERNEVSRSMRVIVGRRLEKEPELANVFSELGHGRFVKGETREVYINGTAQTAMAWTGDFVDSYDNRTISSGSFKVRLKMSPDEHRTRVRDTLAAEMTSVKSAEEMNDALSQYMVATSVGRYPDLVEDLEEPGVRRRLGKVRTMFASMAADGLSAEEQRFAYTAAYVDAVESVQALRPDLGAAWVAQYGENWREKMAEDFVRFNDMGSAAEHEKRGGTHAKRHFSAANSRGTWNATGPTEDEPERTEDIVDAEVVMADEDPPGQARRGAVAAGRRLGEAIYEGEMLDPDDEFLDGEIVEDIELQSGRARAAILPGTTDTTHHGNENRDAAPGESVSSRFRRALVNQQYNEAKTGGITGIGSDDAEPLQDLDFELG